MESGERELRELLKRARLTFSFEDQPAAKGEAENRASWASLTAIAEQAAARAVQLYAESHPRPTQVTQRQVAEMLGISTRSVRNYIVAGKLKLNGCGQIPIEGVDRLRSME